MTRVAPRVCAVLACLLIPAAAASASPEQEFAVGGPSMAAAEQIAVGYWGATPCSGSVDIEWTDLEADTNAVSTWSNPRSAYDDPAENANCRVSFNRLLAFDWPRFCTVLVHEFGHLVGHDHSGDPHDVMAAIYDGPIAACGPAPGTATEELVVAPSKAAPKAATAARHVTRVRHRVKHRVKHRRAGGQVRHRRHRPPRRRHG